MMISNFYQEERPVFSIEIFPPKTDAGVAKLKEKLQIYKGFRPHFISVTYGAGGSTRSNTHYMASYIKNELSIEAMAHLTCVAHTREEIDHVLDELKSSNIENIMALRGDPPQGSDVFQKHENGFGYASELIAALKERGDFGIAAAGYPEGHVEASSWEVDQQHLVEKINAGAQVIVTQFFLDNDYFLRWRDVMRSKGVTVPLVAGILPAQSLEQITRFSQTCGCQLPDTLAQQLKQHEGSADDMRQVGIEFAQQQVSALLKEGVDGIHLYALNRLETVQQIAPLL